MQALILGTNSQAIQLTGYHKSFCHSNRFVVTSLPGTTKSLSLSTPPVRVGGAWILLFVGFIENKIGSRMDI